ncbi:MAG: hypothetical protein ACR2MT_09725 [Aurantibacter sp.]
MIISQSIRNTKNQLFNFLILSCALLGNAAFSQDLDDEVVVKEITDLFKDQEALPLKLNYSNKKVKFDTNDSTYLATDLSYQEADGTWTSLEVDIRARGNFRRKNCYYAPIKMKIRKSEAAQTLFDGNKRLKLVLPCFDCKNANDYIIKEYMAYKLYELISPYHFKTRLVSLNFTEIKGKRTKSHQLKAILVEDIKKVADRHHGNVFKRHMKPMTQDPLTSVQNAFFQYMIANTDFSTTFQHNQKQLFADQKILPVPYDFDMSGLVNSDYAVVSKVQNRVLPIEEVTDRLYKGFERDKKVFQAVREAFLANKSSLFEAIDAQRPYFKSFGEFNKARDFIAGFYRIIENDKKYNNDIVSAARTVVTARTRAK